MLSFGIYLDGRSYQVPGLLRKKRSQEPRMKGGFFTPEMKRLTASPEAAPKKGVTRRYCGGQKICKLLRGARRTPTQKRVSLKREVFSENQEMDEASVTRLRV